MSDIDFKTATKKVIGIGFNYRDPNKEYEAPKGNPYIFIKPSTSIITSGSSIEIPRGFNGEILFEVELGVVIGKPSKFVKEENAMDCVLGYVLSLDMTSCHNMKEYPTLLIKGFDTSCPLGKFIPKTAIKDPNDVNLKLNVNGVEFQNGNTRDLLFKIPKLISYITEFFTLEHGDLILTGTPSGRSTVKHGDVIVASMDDLDKIEFPVIEIGV